MFSAILLQMIKEVLFASGGLLVKPTSSGEIRVTPYSWVRMERVSCGLRHAESARNY
jgi:hypothetical protein